MRRFFALLLAASASCSVYRPGPEGDEGVMPPLEGNAPAVFRTFSEAALQALYSAFPPRATVDGIHDHDGRLGDWTAAGVASRIASLRRHLGRIDAIPPDSLADEDSIDALLLGARLRAELLDLETVRSWRRDPGYYCRLISEGLYGVAALRFDTPQRRLRHAASRLRDVPRVLAAARENLAEPPKLLTEIALEDFAGLLAFVRDDLQKAFGDAVEPSFPDARKEAVDSLSAFTAWLKADLLPRSTGNIALGAEVYRDKLLHEEMVDTPLDVLLDRGYQLLRRTQEEFKLATASKPAEDPAPLKGDLIEEARSMLADLRRWAGTLVTLPEAVDCLVQETPAFRRSTSFASMLLPGPFETTAREAYYSITLPEAGWSDDRKAQHAAFFDRPSLALISVHEAYPGHYAQSLLARRAPSRIRKALGSACFSEGWAHYCEQLYAESGAAGARPAQLRMALLRICRYLVSIEMHTRGMTVEKAADFFAVEGLQSRANAEREARRGAADPLYLVYTLGKSEILRLRDDWRNATGRSLKEFHDALLGLGHPPLKIARRLLLEGRRGGR